MATAKLTIENAELSSFSTNAEATLTYSMEIPEGVSGPNVLIQAMRLAPPLGSIKDFAGVPGAPSPGFNAGIPTNNAQYSHQMRVWRVTPRVVGANAKFVFVDVIYKSRPRASLEAGASGTQVKTETYLADTRGNRKQMTLDWKAVAGVWGSVNGTQNPPSDVQFPLSPLTASRMQFGSTIRMSATYYADEITYNQLLSVQNGYVTSVNFFPFLNNVGFNDSRLWLCNSFNIQSSDQFEFRCAAEFIFSPFGWDAIAIFVAPQMFGNQLAVVTDAALNKVIAGTASNLPVPAPIKDSLSGIGRFPQNVGVDHSPLTRFLYQPAGLDFKTLAQQVVSGGT